MFAKISNWFAGLRTQRDAARAVLKEAEEVEGGHGHTHDRFDGLPHTHDHAHGGRDSDHRHDHT